VLATDPAAKIFATRKVRVMHKGEASYPNDSAWGEQKTDATWAEALTVETASDADCTVEETEEIVA